MSRLLTAEERELREASGRPPPQSLSDEQAVLGAILLSQGQAAFDLPASFTAEAFYRTPHQVLFAAMRRVIEQQQPVDVLTLSEELRKSDELETAGGTDYIAGLSEVVPSTANLKHYATTVLDYARRRELQQAAAEAVRAAYDPATRTETIERGLAAILDGNAFAATLRETTMRQGVERYQARMLARENGEASGQARVAETGIPAFDRNIRIRRGEMIVLGGRPGHGKSLFALQSALHIASGADAQPVMFVNLEMDDDEEVERALMNKGGLTKEQVEEPRAGDSSALMKAMDRVAGTKLSLIEEYDPEVILRECRRRARRGKLGCVVIDYLHVLQIPFEWGHREDQRLGYCAARFRQFAKETGVPVILLSSIKRLESVRPGTPGIEARPSQHDLKESGALESHATIVLIAHVPGKIQGTLEHQQSNHALMEILVQKYRGGRAPQVIELHGDWARQRILDPDDLRGAP